MNKRKLLSIITIIALVMTTVVPALGAAGDGTGSAEWPANINISESTIESASYKLGEVKEFQIGYYPANTSGAVIEATRHIEITGPAQVTGFEFSEDGSTWKDISEFEGSIKITTTTIHKVRAAFHEAGEYTVRLWMTDDKGEMVKESKKELYVSGEGIYVRPNAPTELKETEKKLVFQWQYNANKEVKYNFYIDGEKLNTEEIAEKQYNASAYEEKFTPGIHKISVTSVLVKENKVISTVESEPLTIEYVVEEPATEPETTTEQETTTVEPDTTTEPETTTEQETTTVEPDTTTEQETTTVEPDTTTAETDTTTVELGSTTAQPDVTEKPNTTTEPVTTKALPGMTVKPTTVEPNATKNLKLARGTIKKASKKAAAKKVKVTFKKVKEATSYEVQICRNKKFKKKNTITKTIKKNKCTFKKLKPNKKYYVRVRAVVKTRDKKLYGKWSRKKRVTLKK